MVDAPTRTQVSTPLASQPPVLALNARVPGGGATVAVAAFAYHDVTDDPEDSGFTGPGARPFKLDWPTFTRHLDALAGAGVRPELVTAIDLDAPGRRVLLTFDDGGRSALETGDALCRRGWRGHFFVVTERIGTPGFLDAAQIRYLHGCGHVIGNHSHTHPNIFREQTREQMLTEWRISGERLADVLGERCTVAAVPGGDISPMVLSTAGPAGLRYLFTCEPTIAPELIDGCWMLGRYCPKATTAPERIAELAGFHGWGRAWLVRKAKNLVRTALPGPYRYYVHLQTRRPGA